jgi:hypothetical protein
MRTIVSTIAAFALFGLAQTSQAAESEFQITPRIGQGELTIDHFAGVDEELRETETYGFGLSFGVLTPIGVVFEVGGDSHGRFEVVDEDDDFSLSQRYVAVGYQIPLGDGWQLTPKVARARWKLHSDNSLLDFNSSDNEEMRGYDYVYEATIARKVSRVVTLGLSYKQGDFEFGRARAASFVVQFGFEREATSY